MVNFIFFPLTGKMVKFIFFPPAGNSGPYEQKNGGGIVVIPPPRFTLPASFSVGLSAWRWACALPRCGSRDFRISQRIPKIRTRPQSETDSDFVGLVRLTGVEPVRPFGHKHLKLASLPIPAQPHIEVPKDRSVIILSPAVFVNCFPRTERGVSGQARQSARGLRPGAPSKEAVQRRHAAAVSASPFHSTQVVSAQKELFASQLLL